MTLEGADSLGGGMGWRGGGGCEGGGIGKGWWGCDCGEGVGGVGVVVESGNLKWKCDCICDFVY